MVTCKTSRSVRLFYNSSLLTSTAPFSPHHGRNITIEQFGIAMHEGLGWSPDTGRIPASGVFGVLNLTTTIDLEQLDNRAAGIEHAASIARADDSNDVVPARVQDLLNDSNDPTNLTPGSLALTRIRLEKTSPISEREQQQSVGEAAFVIAAMLNGTVPSTGTEDVDYASFKAPKSWAEDWLAHERLPVKLGWTRSKREVTLADLAGINTAINAAISGGEHKRGSHQG